MSKGRKRKMKITKQVYDRMVEMRKQGATYREIMSTCNVSKWACMNYLSKVKVEPSFVTTVWGKAEKQASAILTKNGFSHIVNLNEICSVAPYWDYYAERHSEKWLIDVTVDLTKSITEKQNRAVNGYRLGILYNESNKWRLLEIRSQIIFDVAV
jgi:hypothetical protein